MRATVFIASAVLSVAAALTGCSREPDAKPAPVAPAASAAKEGTSWPAFVASFIEAGITAVEFGPSGSGHHGPDEWVSLSSLVRYRRALGDFVRSLPARLEQPDSGGGLTAIEGGLA